MAAQKLFGDFPAAVSKQPGMVTPNITADINQGMSIQDQAAAYALRQRMKADERSRWANAAAQNNARMRQAHNLVYKPGGSGDRPDPSWTGHPFRPKTNIPTIPGFQGPIRWLPAGMDSALIGTTVNQANKASMAKGEVPALFLQRPTMPRA